MFDEGGSVACGLKTLVVLILLFINYLHPRLCPTQRNIYLKF